MARVERRSLLRVLSAVAIVGGCIGGSAAPTSAQAPSADAAQAFVAVSPCIVYDSTVAIDPAHAGPFEGGEVRSVGIEGSGLSGQGSAGDCGVPAVAGSVLLHVVARSPQREGNLRVTELGVAPDGGIVNFAPNGLDNSNATIVPLSVDGRIEVSANAGPTGVGLVATDVELVVAGYLGPLTGAPGGMAYVPIEPCAVFDTRPSEGSSGGFVGSFGDGAQLEPQIRGTFPVGQGGGNTACGLPAEAAGVVINLVAVGATGTGSLRLGPSASGLQQLTRFTPLTPSMANSVMAMVPLTAGGTLTLSVDIDGAGSVHARGVALGYLQPVVADASGFVPINPCAAFDARANQGASGSLAGARIGGSVTEFQMAGPLPAGQGGEADCSIPNDAQAVVVNLVAVNPQREGNLRASTSGGAPTGGVVNFANLTPAMNNSNTVVVPLGPDGAIDVGVIAGPPGVGLAATDVRGVAIGYVVPFEQGLTIDQVYFVGHSLMSEGFLNPFSLGSTGYRTPAYIATAASAAGYTATGVYAQSGGTVFSLETNLVLTRNAWIGSDTIVLDTLINGDETAAAFLAKARDCNAYILSRKPTMNIVWVEGHSLAGTVPGGNSNVLSRWMEKNPTLQTMLANGEIAGVVPWAAYAAANPSVYFADGVHHWNDQAPYANQIIAHLAALD